MKEELSHNELITLLHKKDNRAFQYLYAKYYIALKSLAFYYVKNKDVAEDLIQDLFFSLLDCKASFKTINDLKYYLYYSLKNRCISYLRKQQVRDKYSNEMLNENIDRDDYWNKVLEEDIYVKLISAIEILPPKCKVVMELSLQGLTAKEIANKISISIETVKDHKKNGKRKIASFLKDVELILLLQLLFV